MKEVSKAFVQEIQSLESGLNELERIIRNSKERKICDKALKNMEIQKERIEWFKKGYRFCLKEINNQKELI